MRACCRKASEPGATWPTTPPRCGRAAGVEQLRDFGVAKGLLGDALDQVAELKVAMRALRVAES